MKAYVKGLGLGLCIIIVLIGYSNMKNNKDDLTYIDLNQLPNNYTVEDAKIDRCVVFEDLTLVSGSEEWGWFIKRTNANKEAIVRIAYYYSETEELYIVDLSYDASVFSVSEKDGLTKQYTYLNHYTSKGNSDATYETAEYYILVNDESVTFDQLEKALTSSNSSDLIDQYRVYVNLQ